MEAYYMYRYEVYYSILDCDVKKQCEKGLIIAKDYSDAMGKIIGEYDIDDSCLESVFLAPLNTSTVFNGIVTLDKSDVKNFEDFVKWLKED